MLSRALKRTRDGLVTLAYPEDCRVCGGMVESLDDGVACAACWHDQSITRLFAGPLCFKCGLPMKGEQSLSDVSSETASRDGRLCGKCAPLPFHAARACGTYSGAIKASIIFLKSHPHVCRRLREIILATFSNHLEALESDIVLPIPLHSERERERGFNQAAVIAKLLAHRFDLPLVERAMARVRYTEMHRAGLDEIDRAKSVEQAFKIIKPQAVRGATVLLVDDLYTTGSTICVSAKTLMDAGARRVNVFTIARVVPRLTRG